MNTGTRPLAGRDVLEQASPKPFRGRPDHKYAELDTQDPLYSQRYLVREWGWDTFSASSHYGQWAVEASRTPGNDPKKHKQ